MDATYTAVGTEVVIGFGARYTYLLEVQRYLCRRGLITEAKQGTNGSGVTAWARVDISDTLWWPVDDMILASDIDLLTPEQKSRIR